MYLKSVFVLILLEVEFIFSWSIDCEENQDCCGYYEGTTRKTKSDCENFNLPHYHNGKITPTQNMGNLEYYTFKSDRTSHVLRLNWIEFRMSVTMTGCTKDKVYVQVG